MQKRILYYSILFLFLISLSVQLKAQTALSTKSKALTHYETIAAGHEFSMVIKNGALFGWGANNVGQLGIGNQINQPSPVRIGKASNWVSVSAANTHVLALQSDGSLWAWGYNYGGELGLGSFDAPKEPVRVGKAADWVSVSTADRHTVALKKNGTIWAWGVNVYGQLGIGKPPDHSKVPVQVGKDTNWIKIIAGRQYTLALKSNGTLWSWGINERGELGNGSTQNQFTPLKVGSDNDWADIFPGTNHSFALKADGTLWGWGLNSSGQLGIGNNINQQTPVLVANTSGWTKVYPTERYTLAIKADGTLWSWGARTNPLGKDITHKWKENIPLQVGLIANCQDIATGNNHGVLTKTDGSLWAWGNNRYGQLGVEAKGGTVLPVQVSIP